jgi:hypothetical protein
VKKENPATKPSRAAWAGDFPRRDQNRGIRAPQAMISKLKLGKARTRRKPEKAARPRLRRLMTVGIILRS